MGADGDETVDLIVCPSLATLLFNNVTENYTPPFLVLYVGNERQYIPPVPAWAPEPANSLFWDSAEPENTLFLRGLPKDTAPSIRLTLLTSSNSDPSPRVLGKANFTVPLDKFEELNLSKGCCVSVTLYVTNAGAWQECGSIQLSLEVIDSHAYKQRIAAKSAILSKRALLPGLPPTSAVVFDTTAPPTPMITPGGTGQQGSKSPLLTSPGGVTVGSGALQHPLGSPSALSADTGAEMSPTTALLASINASQQPRELEIPLWQQVARHADAVEKAKDEEAMEAAVPLAGVLRALQRKAAHVSAVQQETCKRAAAVQRAAAVASEAKGADQSGATSAATAASVSAAVAQHLTAATELDVEADAVRRTATVIRAVSGGGFSLRAVAEKVGGMGGGLGGAPWNNGSFRQ